MSRRRFLILIAAVISTAAALFWLRPSTRASGPLPHDTYVWQRAWKGTVHQAVAGHATNFNSLVVLHAELNWHDRQPQLVRVPLPWEELSRTPARLGLALRIGPFSGPFADDDTPARFLTGLAQSLLAEARSNHCPVVELQLDFDCAESKLAGYRVWVEAVRRAAAPVPLTVTALPSWLKRGAFTGLVRATDGFVLQVHSIEPPRGINAPFTLCDPVAARQAVERAARAGVPFRVALPTYGYLVAFDRDGRFFGLAAEGPSRPWPEGTQFREVMADPAAMAALTGAFTRDRPSELCGVIWYRLPVAGDVLSWRWATLQSVLAGKIPRAGLRAVVRKENELLAEIELHNTGDADYIGTVRVLARSAHARVLASDAVQGFELRSPSDNKFQFDRAGFRLPPGEHRVIGWLRLERDAEIMLELQSD